MKQIQRSERETEEHEREWNEKDSGVREAEEQERQQNERDSEARERGE